MAKIFLMAVFLNVSVLLIPTVAIAQKPVLQMHLQGDTAAKTAELTAVAIAKVGDKWLLTIHTAGVLVDGKGVNVGCVLTSSRSDQLFEIRKAMFDHNLRTLGARVMISCGRSPRDEQGYASIDLDVPLPRGTSFFITVY